MLRIHSTSCQIMARQSFIISLNTVIQHLLYALSHKAPWKAMTDRFIGHRNKVEEKLLTVTIWLASRLPTDHFRG